VPTYNFRQKETGEVIEKVMKFSERDEWIAANPDYEQVHIQMPNIGDPIRLGITKPPSDFQKHIIGKVASMHGADVQSKFGIPKEW